MWNFIVNFKIHVDPHHRKRFRDSLNNIQYLHFSIQVNVWKTILEKTGKICPFSFEKTVKKLDLLPISPSWNDNEGIGAY